MGIVPKITLCERLKIPPYQRGMFRVMRNRGMSKNEVVINSLCQIISVLFSAKFFMSETVDKMIIHHSGCLHVCIDYS